MQIVIEIPDFLYQIIQDCKVIEGTNDGTVENVLVKAVEDGVVLPKGHGDLKDANKLKHAFITWSMAVHGNFTDADIASIIYNSQTIIGADTESKI